MLHAATVPGLPGIQARLGKKEMKLSSPPAVVALNMPPSRRCADHKHGSDSTTLSAFIHNIIQPSNVSSSFMSLNNTVL